MKMTPEPHYTQPTNESTISLPSDGAELLRQVKLKYLHYHRLESHHIGGL